MKHQIESFFVKCFEKQLVNMEHAGTFLTGQVKICSTIFSKWIQLSIDTKHLSIWMYFEKFWLK